MGDKMNINELRTIQDLSLFSWLRNSCFVKQTYLLWSVVDFFCSEGIAMHNDVLVIPCHWSDLRRAVSCNFYMQHFCRSRMDYYGLQCLLGALMLESLAVRTLLFLLFLVWQNCAKGLRWHSVAVVRPDKDCLIFWLHIESIWKLFTGHMLYNFIHKQTFLWIADVLLVWIATGIS